MVWTLWSTYLMILLLIVSTYPSRLSWFFLEPIIMLGFTEHSTIYYVCCLCGRHTHLFTEVYWVETSAALFYKKMCVVCLISMATTDSLIERLMGTVLIYWKVCELAFGVQCKVDIIKGEMVNPMSTVWSDIPSLCWQVAKVPLSWLMNHHLSEGWVMGQDIRE